MNSSQDDEGTSTEDAEGVSAEGDALSAAFQFDEQQFAASEFNEVDFDCENVNSPGASSTSSEPVYIRQPGFDYHAHQFKAKNLKPSVYAGSGVMVHSTIQIIDSPTPQPDVSFYSPLSQDSRGTASLDSRGHAFQDLRGEAASQTSFFPSPPQTPVSGFLSIHSPISYLDSLNPEPLRSANEIHTKLASHSSLSKYAQLPPSGESSTSQSRTGNHTPPGESTGKKTKKKKITFFASDPSREGTPEIILPPSVKHKTKTKREPLPMKLRALPQSFWTQPNRTNNMPPSCSVLPPLIIGKDISEVIEMSPCSPFGDKDAKYERPTERIIKVGNTDLLFRLFDKVEKDEKKKSHVVRRGRPRKTGSTHCSKGKREEDPCLVSTATESILPLLPDRTAASSGSSTPSGIRYAQGQQILEFVNMKEGDRTVSLPSLNSDHGYSQLLSELVLRL